MSETAVLLEAWRAVIGLIFILVVLYLPRGLAGLADDAAATLLRARGAPADEPVPADGTERLPLASRGPV